MSLRMNLVAALAMAFAAVPTAHAEDAVDMGNGKELFELCQQCHGQEGHGNADFLAPAIAGFDAWYLEMQLGEFRTGLRGLHFDDIAGMRMRPMSLTLRTDQEIKNVVAYVASLPKADLQSTLEGGSAETGRAFYTICAACHGLTGAGIEPMKAPALNHVDDWYLVTQLEKFKSGVRGTRPGDSYGALMAPMAQTLKTDQSVRDVVAYIMTLEQKK